MATTNIYVVKGSEDGVIAARTNAMAAVLDAVAYIHDTGGGTGEDIQGHTQELKQDGFTRIGHWRGITADVIRFRDKI